VSCPPSIQAGGGTGLILIWQDKSGIPPNPPFLFARLLELRPEIFLASEWRDLKLGGGRV